jgi:hypothetical protein
MEFAPAAEPSSALDAPELAENSAHALWGLTVIVDGLDAGRGVADRAPKDLVADLLRVLAQDVGTLGEWIAAGREGRPAEAQRL